MKCEIGIYIFLFVSLKVALSYQTFRCIVVDVVAFASSLFSARFFSFVHKQETQTRTINMAGDRGVEFNLKENQRRIQCGLICANHVRVDQCYHSIKMAPRIGAKLP